MITAAGWWNAPTRFLPSGRSTPVLPPIDESIWATSVVGTWISGTPRSQVAARNPAASPSAPPPIATMRLAAVRPQAGELPRRSLDDRQPLRVLALGQHDPLDRQPSAARAADSASPAAAQAPGSETRIARRAPMPAQRRRDLDGRDPRAEHDVAGDRVGPEEHGAGRPRGSRGGELVDPVDQARHLGRAVQPLAGGVEPRPVPGELADRPDRVAALRRAAGRSGCGGVAGRGPRAGRRARSAGGHGRGPSGCAGRSPPRRRSRSRAGRPDRRLPARARPRLRARAPGTPARRRPRRSAGSAPAVGLLDRLVEVDAGPRRGGGRAAGRRRTCRCRAARPGPRPPQSSPPEPDSASAAGAVAGHRGRGRTGGPRRPRDPLAVPLEVVAQSRPASRRRTCRARSRPRSA